jgi:hypothetical protein
VNFFMGCVGAIQLTRIIMYQQSLKNSPILQQVEEKKDQGIDKVKEGIEKAKDIVS